jgi:hypothetical protein
VTTILILALGGLGAYLLVCLVGFIMAAFVLLLENSSGSEPPKVTTSVQPEPPEQPLKW